MLTDNQLLEAYARTRSEGAFRELVERRANFVYSIAMRHVGGQTQLAEEVTQSVFTDLARKAASVSRHPALQGWLFKSAYYSATTLLRSERRRALRETEAHVMATPSSNPTNSPEWDRLRPALDEVINALGEKDREAVLLRFVHGQEFSMIAAELGLSADGARSRVNRALDRMRTLLVRRGITSTTAALGLALSNESLLAAPAGLSADIAAKALLAGSLAAVGPISFLTWSLLTSTIGAIALIAGGVTSWSQDRANDSLRREIADLRATNALVAQLRDENTRLRRALATPPSRGNSPAIIGADLDGGADDFVPIGRLRPLDSITPLHAFESIYWAKERIDLGVLEKRIILTPAGRARVERYFGQLPAAARARFPEVTSPERMIAMAWAMTPEVVSLRLDQLIENGGDRVTLIGKINYRTQLTLSCELQLLHLSDGWRWQLSDRLVDDLLTAITQRLTKA